MESQVNAGNAPGRYLLGWASNELWPRAALQIDIPFNYGAALSYVFRRNHTLPVASWWPARYHVIGWPVDLYSYLIDARRITPGERARLVRHLSIGYHMAEAEAERVIGGGFAIVADWLKVTPPVWRLQ